jgi:hypothetical protein
MATLRAPTTPHSLDLRQVASNRSQVEPCRAEGTGITMSGWQELVHMQRGTAGGPVQVACACTWCLPMLCRARDCSWGVQPGHVAHVIWTFATYFLAAK